MSASCAVMSSVVNEAEPFETAAAASVREFVLNSAPVKALGEFTPNYMRVGCPFPKWKGHYQEAVQLSSPPVRSLASRMWKTRLPLGTCAFLTTMRPMEAQPPPQVASAPASRMSTDLGAIATLGRAICRCRGAM